MRSISRRRFALELGAAAAAAGLGCSRPAARPPNIVLILVDDLGWTDLGCFGSTFYETPNVDRLAAQGMRFTNAYAACPVCSPTRASILTGKYPARLNITDWIPGRKQWPAARLLVPSFRQQLPHEEVTIAEMLQPAGYTSASTGKWHLGGAGYDPTSQGFSLNVAGTERGAPRSYFGPFDLPNLQGGSEQDYLTDVLTSRALEFIERNRATPFFLYLPLFQVHLPLQAKKQSIAKYEARAQGRELQANPVYGAMVEHMDTAVGRVLGKLEELGLGESTVVIFTGDNGGLLYEGAGKDAVTSNRPLRAGKGHLYEGGIRVPAIVRWPGVTRPGASSGVPISSVDYFPTVREIAGLSGGGSAVAVDGASIAPLLRGRGQFERRALYWHYPHYSNQGGQPGGALREDNWKLIEFYEDSHLELYDLASDAGERNDLAPKIPDKARELQARLRAWRESVGANLPSLNPAFDARKSGQGLTGADPARQ